MFTGSSLGPVPGAHLSSHLTWWVTCTECHFAAADLFPIKVSVTWLSTWVRLGAGPAAGAGPVASGASVSRPLGPNSCWAPGPAAIKMETGVLDTSNASSPDSDSLVLDSDLYDVDTYDVPDPGLLSEKDGEGTCTHSGAPLGTEPHSVWVLSWEHNCSGQPLTQTGIRRRASSLPTTSTVGPQATGDHTSSACPQSCVPWSGCRACSSLPATSDGRPCPCELAPAACGWSYAPTSTTSWKRCGLPRRWPGRPSLKRSRDLLNFPSWKRPHPHLSTVGLPIPARRRKEQSCAWLA